jgi:Ca2+-binding EF-hand superfamily protein
MATKVVPMEQARKVPSTKPKRRGSWRKIVPSRQSIWQCAPEWIVRGTEKLEVHFRSPANIRRRKAQSDPSMDPMQMMKSAMAYHKSEVCKAAGTLHLTKNEVLKIAKLFQMVREKSPTHTVQKRDLFAHFDIPPEQADVLWEVFDQDKSGNLDLDEIISGVSSLCKGNYIEKARFIFNLMDADGSKELDRAEMMQIVSWMSKTAYMVNSRTHEIHSQFATTATNKPKAGGGGRGRGRRQSISHGVTASAHDDSSPGIDAEFERRRASLVTRLFSQADADGGGTIDEEEFLKWVDTNDQAQTFIDQLARSARTVFMPQRGSQAQKMIDEDELSPLTKYYNRYFDNK